MLESSKKALAINKKNSVNKYKKNQKKFLKHLNSYKTPPTSSR